MRPETLAYMREQAKYHEIQAQMMMERLCGYRLEPDDRARTQKKLKFHQTRQAQYLEVVTKLQH